MTSKKEKLIEITRSFTYKLNLGSYQSADFFCSQKCECLEEEAQIKSKALYEWCKKEVLKSISDFKKGLDDPTLTLKKSVMENPIPSVNQWEEMTPEEQAFRQEVKKKDARREYEIRKNKQ